METCQLTNKSTLEELNMHHTMEHSPKLRPFTHELKMFARDMAMNDMRPQVIRNAMAVHFAVDASELPTLEQVQQHVGAFRRNHHANHDDLKEIAGEVGSVAFTGRESKSQTFSFGLGLDAAGRPRLGRGTDQHPFFIGFTTRKLILQLDHDPEYIFHIDTTFKLAEVDFPTIACGVSGRSREFHLVAVFQTSQRTAAIYQRAMSSVRAMFRQLTGRRLELANVMGDADAAQLKGVMEAFRGDQPPRYLMCFYHVIAKVLEHTKSIPKKKAKAVMRDIYDMHFNEDSDQFCGVRDGALWRDDNDTAAFVDYFNHQWLQGSFSNWQWFWTSTGFATTNNPLEQFNNIIKSRHTLRQRLKMGTLLAKLRECCHLQSGDATPVSTTRAPNKDIIARAKAMMASGNLWATRAASMATLLGPSVEDESKVHVRSTLVRKRKEGEKEFLTKSESVQVGKLVTWHNQRMEIQGQPATGWPVDVVAQTCPCKYCFKYGYCIHLICALKERDMPYPGEKIVLFDRSSRNGRRGRSRKNGPTLTRV